MKWFDDLMAKLGQKKAEVQIQVQKTADEIAEDLQAEANDLFQKAHDAREHAAEVLEDAAAAAKLEAQQVKDNAERAAALAKARVDALVAAAEERLTKAKTNRTVAQKLKDFLD
jgi:hypothetical protein